ncbi:hypothetical protein TeGR_g371, partial [Tetraparma gracilis]
GETFVIDTVEEAEILDEMILDDENDEKKLDMAVMGGAIAGGCVALLVVFLCCKATSFECSFSSNKASHREGERVMDARLAAAEVQLVDFRPEAKQIHV